MYRRHARIISYIQRLADIISAVGAWLSAYFIRFWVMEGSTGLFDEFALLSIVLALLVIVFSTRNHLYETARYFPWHRETIEVIKSQFQAVITFVILLYFAWPDRLSRLSIGLYIGFGLVYSLISRGAIRALLHRARRKGRNLRHVLVVGRGDALEQYVRSLTENLTRGVRLIGWVDSGGCADAYDVEELALEDVNLESVKRPDAVIIGYDSTYENNLDRLLAFFNQTFLQILIVPEVENAFIGYTIQEFHGVPMISVNASRLSMINAFAKRFIDLFGALLGLIVLSPFLFFIGVLVKATSKGPVFYGQERMTLDGRTFKMWKFRSMRTDAESKGAQWASKGDDRRTPIGAFLRKTSVDELPQLWNVLVGDMSLVGPRPERPVFIKQFKDEIPSYMLRHRMKAGITGWAQVNGWRGNTSLEKRIEFDLYYIRNWSLTLDIKILFLTLIKGFINENAY